MKNGIRVLALGLVIWASASSLRADGCGITMASCGGGFTCRVKDAYKESTYVKNSGISQDQRTDNRCGYDIWNDDCGFYVGGGSATCPQ